VLRPGGDASLDHFAKNAWKYLTESACERLYNQTGKDLMMIAKVINK
jgi:hypothetical protein